MSFTSISFNLSLIIGPSLAAPLYFTFGVEWAIAIDVLSFVISFLAIMVVQLPEALSKKKIRENKNFLREFRDGLLFFRGNRLLVVLLIAGVLFQFGAGPSDALYVLFGIQNLHTPKNLLGLFEANYGIGVVVGLLAVIYLAKGLGEIKVFWMSFLMWGSCMVIFGRTTNFIAGFALFFLLGFANAGINVVVGPLMLKATPREFVGRVQSVNTPLITGSSLVATALAGFFASTVLNGFHASLLGSSFGTLDTLFSLSGFIVMGAGVYVLFALRNTM
jgi:Na+/melibiose symporter-like transporter